MIFLIKFSHRLPVKLVILLSRKEFQKLSILTHKIPVAKLGRLFFQESLNFWAWDLEFLF